MKLRIQTGRFHFRKLFHISSSSSSKSDGALSAAVVIQKSTSTISIRCKAWCTIHIISWQFFHVICPRCWWTTFPNLSFYSTLKYLLSSPAVSSDNMTKISVVSLHDPRSEVQICSNPFKYPGVSSFVFPCCLQKTSEPPHLESINPLPAILSHSPWLTSIGGNREATAFRRGTFRLMEIPRLFQMFCILCTVDLAIANLLLISIVLSPMILTIEPRYSNWLTSSICCPSMMKSSFVLFLSTIIILVFLVFRSSLFKLASLMRPRRSSSSCLLLQINVVSSAYLRLVIFVTPNFAPPLKPSRASLMMSSEYMLKRIGDKIYPWRTPLPISHHSVSPPPVLSADWLYNRVFHLSWSFMLDRLDTLTGNTNSRKYHINP